MQDQPNTLQHTESAAIYVRISADHAGRALGVERQLEACQEMAARRGWNVTHVFSDNDISAYSGKRRPGYEQLLELMKSGEVRVVAAIHTDRIHRSPTELESFITICEAHNVRVETVQAGPVDLSTATGRMGARIYGAVARHEVEHMIERQRAAKLQAARSGAYMGGQRPYGFEPRREGIRGEEAAIIRELADRFIKGASFWSLAIDLNQRGILTQHGADWNALKIRNLLRRPINAGIVLHKGVEYPAESPAILTQEVWEQLNDAMAMSKLASTHPGRTRKHLLQGYLFCGLCGKKMFHKSKQQRDGSYKTTAACGKTDSQTGKQHGCGKVSRMVEPIIDLLTDCIMIRLDTPELSVGEASGGQGAALRDLTDRQRVLERRSVEVQDDYYVNHVLTREQFERMKSAVDLELANVQLAIDQQTSDRLTSSARVDFRARWDASDLHWQRELLNVLVVKIVVHPRPRVDGYTYPRYKDVWRFDPELIEISWKS